MRLIVTFALLACAACAAHIPPTLSVPPLTPGDYAHVLNVWTRKDELFRVFEHKMSIRATLIAPMLRKAFELRFPEIYGHGSQVTRKELVDLPNRSDETINFYVTVYTPNEKWNDLHKPDSIWRISLQKAKDENDTSEKPIDARSIEKVKIDENLRTVYPYMTDFDHAYVVRFPNVGPDGQPMLAGDPSFLRLRIASSFGHGSMLWKVLP